MSFASKRAKGSKFDINTEGFEYKSLDELVKENGINTQYKILGFYINKKSRYGDAPVAICEGFFANFPNHMLEEVKEILQDPEDIADIKAGKVGFTIEEYTSKTYGTDCLGVQWVDL